MMTYLKHVGNFKHAELKIKKFEEIQALYEKIKRSDEDFISIGSAEDERLIKRMNEKGIDSSKSEMIKEERVRRRNTMALGVDKICHGRILEELEQKSELMGLRRIECWLNTTQQMVAVEEVIEFKRSRDDKKLDTAVYALQ
ncbi:hypothetical protein Tco_0352781 [Tanacetum coccineum]